MIDRDALKGKDEANCTVQIVFDNGQNTFSRLLFKAENGLSEIKEDIPYLKSIIRNGLIRNGQTG